MFGCKTYWTIELDPKPLYEVNAESWVFFWPLQSNVLIAPQWKFLRFRRVYLILAMMLVQLCAGALYAYLNLADAINVHFKRPPGSSETTVLAIESGLASIIAQAFMGPLLERKGPRKSMAVSTIVLVAGFAVVQTALLTLSWPLFLVGAGICGVGFGGIIVLSVTIALKWSPDLRGTVTGCCLLGFGIGKEISLQYFDRVVDDDDSELPKVFWLLLIISASILTIATIVIRTPPNDFQINGHNMHCIPVNKAPNVDFVQDEYLQIGMTLVNYKAITRRSDSLIEDTDCHYYEQVKALTLPQCILSTDFLCLFLALFTNCLVGLFYNNITATKYPKDPLEEIYSIDESVVDSLRVNGIIVNLTGRLVMPIISDLIIRLLYANPAVVRKFCFTFVLLLQCITLIVVHFGSNNLTNFSYVEWLLYLLHFASNSGASLIVCVLADMFGVYHIGTMYGLTSITWVLGAVLLVLLPMKTIPDVAHQVELFWYISLAGLLLMFFVRTNSTDRFYCGYQFTLCGKIVIQRPWRRDYATRTMDVYADGNIDHSIFHRGSIPYLCASDSLGTAAMVDVNDTIECLYMDYLRVGVYQRNTGSLHKLAAFASLKSKLSRHSIRRISMALIALNKANDAVIFVGHCSQVNAWDPINFYDQVFDGAMVLYELKAYSPTIDILKRLLGKTPLGLTRRDLLLIMATCHMHTGQISTARRLMNTLLQNTGSNVLCSQELWITLARTLYELGFYGVAANLFTCAMHTVLSLDMSKINAYTMLSPDDLHKLCLALLYQAIPNYSQLSLTLDYALNNQLKYNYQLRELYRKVFPEKYPRKLFRAQEKAAQIIARWFHVHWKTTKGLLLLGVQGFKTYRKVVKQPNRVPKPRRLNLLGHKKMKSNIVVELKEVDEPKGIRTEQLLEIYQEHSLGSLEERLRFICHRATTIANTFSAPITQAHATPPWLQELVATQKYLVEHKDEYITAWDTHISKHLNNVKHVLENRAGTTTTTSRYIQHILRSIQRKQYSQLDAMFEHVITLATKEEETRNLIFHHFHGSG